MMYPGCQRLFLCGFRFWLFFPVSVKSLFDTCEKPPDQSAVPLMTPSQWQAGINRFQSDFGWESWLAFNDHLQIFETNRGCDCLLKNAKNSTAEQHCCRRKTTVFQVCLWSVMASQVEGGANSETFELAVKERVGNVLKTFDWKVKSRTKWLYFQLYSPEICVSHVADWLWGITCCRTCWTRLCQTQITNDTQTSKQIVFNIEQNRNLSRDV